MKANYNGISWTSKQEKTIDKEINKQIAESMKELEIKLDCLILYCLREKYGFGKQRLLEFQKYFRKQLGDLIAYYELDKLDTPWICAEKLKQIGINPAEFETEPNIFQYQTHKERERK